MKWKGNLMEQKFVSLMIKRLLIEQNKHDRSGIYAYTQRKLAYNSNKIEGSRLTEKQTASIFNTGTIIAEDYIIRTKDVEEMTGHFTMFNHMLNTYDKPLTEDLIKSYHYDLKAGVFEDLANGYPIGEYKNRKNIVADIETTAPQDVPNHMKQLLEEYHSKKEHTLKDLALFHAKYETIHPFQDGNGRTGRIILFKECLNNGILPFIIEDEKKYEYYYCFSEYQQTGNIDKLLNFFIQEQEIYKSSVKEFIVPEQTYER